MSFVSRKKLDAFTLEVQNLGRENFRELSWRKTCDPWHILVSEVMLQQTQAVRVEKYFSKFISTFPTALSCARAPFHDVLERWNGLGYNRRAKYLYSSAKSIVDECGGLIPGDALILEKLPGIGRNTAGAICAFAFNKPAVFIETNIRSAYIHHFFSRRQKIHDSEIIPLIRRTLDCDKPREWYWALMDYGAYLKGSKINPSRKSALYTKQSTFEGSDRKIRGELIRHTLIKPRTVNDFHKMFKISRERLAGILCSLEKDGIIERAGSRWSIAK